MTEVQKLTNNKEIIAYLAEKFPLCFSLEGETKPLKIGLFQDLSEALKDDERISKTQLRHALRQYGCKVGAVRVDLQGNPAGELEQEHADHAAQQLAEAKALVAQKRAAEKAAKAATEKKRSVRRTPKQGEKTVRKPKLALTSVNMAELQEGQQVKVKVGDRAQNAKVLEFSNETARVELDNGLVVNVTADRLFA